VATATWSLYLRHDAEHAIMLEADDRKIPLVEGEDDGDVLPLGKMGEGGVGQVESDMLIATHDGGDGCETPLLQREDIKHPSGVSVGDTVEWPRLFPQSPGGLAQHRPTGQQRRGKRGKSVGAQAMAAVRRGQEGHEGPGVEENAAISHDRSLPCARG
jgi:hypothetical protein